MFFKDDAGAVSVDWIVMTAGVVGLGFAAIAVTSQGTEVLSTSLAKQIAPGGTASEAFVTEGSLKGWRMRGAGFSGDIVHVMAPGADGRPGYAVYVDQSEGFGWLDLPPPYEGDQSDALGGSLTWSMSILAGDGAPASSTPPLLQMTGANGLRLTYALSDLPDFGDWTDFEAPFDANAWQVGPRAATEEELASVMADIDTFEMRVEFLSGSEAVGIDNVVLNAPEG